MARVAVHDLYAEAVDGVYPPNYLPDLPVTVYCCTTIQTYKPNRLVRLPHYCAPEHAIDKSRALQLLGCALDHAENKRLIIYRSGNDSLGRMYGDLKFTMAPTWIEDPFLELTVPQDSVLRSELYPEMTMGEFMRDNAPVPPASYAREVEHVEQLLTLTKAKGNVML